jgi:asparagine synthetase B (glutamine-hydrolysing)
MTELARRDRLGAERLLFDPGSGAHARDLRTLLLRVPSLRWSGLDSRGVDAAWGLVDAPDRTCLRGVRAVPPGMALVTRAEGVAVAPASVPPCDAPLDAVLIDAASRALGSARRPVVALGGGIDGPLAVLAARRAGVVVAEALHLAIPGSSYDESAEARAAAEALGLALHEIAVTTHDLARELPRAVGLAETPLYNLHPVSRVILARVAAARGHDVLVTGDGADQASRGATEAADYVPIVAAITRRSGMGLASPFLDDAVVALLARSPDPGKKALRELAVAWGLPRALAERGKVPAFAPALPRESFPPAPALARVGRALGRTLVWSADDRVNVGAASLLAFVGAFELVLEPGGSG